MNFAFVTFQDEAEAKNFVDMKLDFKGRSLKLDWSKSTKTASHSFHQAGPAKTVNIPRSERSGFKHGKIDNYKTYLS
jgi:hypothetical protein